MALIEAALVLHARLARAQLRAMSVGELRAFVDDAADRVLENDRATRAAWRTFN